MNDHSTEFLRRLVATPSPSGHETAIAALFRSHVQSSCDSLSTDVHGNTFAVLNPDAPRRLMLAAHMDELGYTIHYIDDKGLLFFSFIGGQANPVPLGQQVWVHGRERVAGVVGRKAIHLLDPDKQNDSPELHEMWIDIGASSREEAERVVAVGDVAAVQAELLHLLGGRISGRALDNKVGLYIMAEAVRRLRGSLQSGIGLYAVATVQEEVGSRGATAGSFEVAPLTGLAIDMEHALDYPDAEPRKFGRMALGKGPSISKGPNTNPVVLELLLKCAEREGIPVQLQAASKPTPTDAKQMQVVGHGMAAGLVGVPLRYMHTPAEVVDLADVENCIRLVVAYCQAVGPETDFRPL